MEIRILWISLHEREWFTRMLESSWFDLLRNHLGEKKGPYTWWSNFRNARERDRGWRIDYILANQAARKLLVSAEGCEKVDLLSQTTLQ